MKYNLSSIMKKAWEIKKENTENIFGECLKMAWAEAMIDPVAKAEKELLKEYKVRLIKEVEGRKDMLFFMSNGDTRVVENAKKVYAGRELNNIRVIIVIDDKGRRYMVCADVVKRMAFGTK